MTLRMAEAPLAGLRCSTRPVRLLQINLNTTSRRLAISTEGLCSKIELRSRRPSNRERSGQGCTVLLLLDSRPSRQSTATVAFPISFFHSRGPPAWNSLPKFAAADVGLCHLS